MAPRRKGCNCHVDRPVVLLDELELKVVENVRRHGYHTMVVSGEVCDHDGGHAVDDHVGPEFAYTIGLWHARSHPELIVSGLSPELLINVAAQCADRVLRGQRLTPGSLWENALGNVAVTTEALTATWSAELATWAHWFHRAEVPVLQVVWPDTFGLFAWQHTGAASVLDLRQPPQWRVPGPRSGLLASHPQLPAGWDGDALTAVCRHVTERRAPLMRVRREWPRGSGRRWTALCARPTHRDDELTVEHLVHVVQRNPSLLELRELAPGTTAQRSTPNASWVRCA